MLEKGDIIRLTGGMKLLCDGVILKGKLKYLNFHDFRVVDSICYGWDRAFIASQGTRLKSGADILEGEAIFMIENPIE